jgi:hypothetical protein
VALSGHDRHTGVLAHRRLLAQLRSQANGGLFSNRLVAAEVLPDALVPDQVLLRDIAELPMVVAAEPARELLLKGGLPIAKRAATAVLSLAAGASTVGVGRPACVVQALVSPKTILICVRNSSACLRCTRSWLLGHASPLRGILIINLLRGLRVR